MKILTGTLSITVLVGFVAASLLFWDSYPDDPIVQEIRISDRFAEEINRPVQEVYAALMAIDGSPPMKRDKLETFGGKLVKNGKHNQTLSFSAFYEEETITRINFELQPTSSGDGTLLSGRVEFLNDPKKGNRVSTMSSRMEYAILIEEALSLMSHSADAGKSLTHDSAILPLKTALHAPMINETLYQLLPTFPSVSHEFSTK